MARLGRVRVAFLGQYTRFEDLAYQGYQAGPTSNFRIERSTISLYSFLIKLLCLCLFEMTFNNLVHRNQMRFEHGLVTFLKASFKSDNA